MIALLALTPAAWETLKSWLVPLLVGSVPVLLLLLTQRSKRVEARRAEATDVERLYVGSAQDLIKTLQGELTLRNSQIGGLEKTREQLRSALSEERQVLEILKQRHRDLTTFLAAAGVKVPDDLLL